MIDIHLIHANLRSANVVSGADVVVSDPPFSLAGPEVIERMYNRKKSELVGGYQETQTPDDLYRALVTHTVLALKAEGIGMFISGWSHYHTLRNAIAASSLTMLNDMVFPYSFGVYAPRKFTTSHYNGALVERTKGKGRLARQHLSQNKRKPYSPDVIPFKREYRAGLPRYVNTLSPDLTKKLAWHLIPDGAKVVDLCAGACGFTRGILRCPEITSCEVWAYDNNEQVLELAATLLQDEAQKFGKSLTIHA